MTQCSGTGDRPAKSLRYRFRVGIIHSSMRHGGKLFWLVVWGTAFGVTEGAVVVYLRRIFYPGLPAVTPLFPLRDVDRPLLMVEMAREAATLVMLFGVAMLAERRPVRRFAVFAFCFGIWDLAYYAALRVAIGWPRTLMEWDILFLLPRPWAAPVLAPVLVSLAMIAGAAVLIERVGEHGPHPFRARDWWIQAACAGVIVWSFLWNDRPVTRMLAPTVYPWWLFLLGLLSGVVWYARGWLVARASAPRPTLRETDAA